MNIILQLGYKCNLKCPYCYQKDNVIFDEMSRDVMDKFIDRVNESNDNFSIHFLGGEPFMYYDKMNYIIDRIKDLSSVIFTVATNGTFKKEFYELQDKLGYEIPNLLSNKPGMSWNRLNSKSSFRFVATPHNIRELSNTMIDFLVKEYGSNIEILYDTHEKWNSYDYKFMKNVKEYFKRKLGDRMFKMGLPSQNVTFECSCQCCIIDTNGNYLYCDRIRSNTVGNIFNDDFKVLGKRECIYYRNISNFYKADDEVMNIQLFSN